MRRELTPEEIVAVNLATKGERFSHRRWPQDVIAAFAAAGVGDAGESRRRPLLGTNRLTRRLPFALSPTRPINHIFRAILRRGAGE